MKKQLTEGTSQQGDKQLKVQQQNQVQAVSRAKGTARKSKGGCDTCRHRHVKCDGTRPRCNRCIALGRVCLGIFYSGSQVARMTRQNNNASYMTQPARMDSYSDDGKKFGDILTLDLSNKLLPVDWHYRESFAFLTEVVMPQMNQAELIHNKDVPRRVPDSFMEDIIARVISLRIFAISTQQGIGFFPSERHGTSHLWHRLYERMSATIERVNQEITARSITSGEYHTCQKIIRLVAIEMTLQLPTWRAHANGLLAYIHHCGTIRMTDFSTQRVLHSVHKIIVTCVLANSMGPPNDQLVGLSYHSAEDLVYTYSFLSDSVFPCPTVLFAELLSILRLRVNIYNDSLTMIQAAKVATGIFTKVESFDPDNWTEDNIDLPDVTEVSLMARIFQFSIILYGLQALPPKSLRYFISQTPSIVHYRKNLLNLIVTAWKTKGCRTGLTWPLAVVGCALSRGSTDDKAMVLKYISAHGDYPFSSQHIPLLAKLTKFWASGSRSWDLCWGEPFIPVD